MSSKNFLLLTGVTLLTNLFISSCKDDNIDESLNQKEYQVFGKVEKGPFISGSNVTIQPILENMQSTGEIFTTNTKDDIGSYDFNIKLLQPPYVEMNANGYFYNEIKDDLSQSTINLKLLTKLSDTNNRNINVLTHLIYYRIKKLVSEGKKFEDANKQAQQEILAQFGLQKYSDIEISSFSISNGDEQASLLLAISTLIMHNEYDSKNEVELTEFMSKLSQEFSIEGKFTNQTKEIINKNKESLFNSLPRIKEQVKEKYNKLGVKIEIKNLAEFIDWDNDGIAGNEILKDGEEVILETKELIVPNEGGIFNINFTSPIPLYTESNNNGDDNLTPSVMEIYDKSDIPSITPECQIKDDKLTIKLNKLNSKFDVSGKIYLYDCIGNTLGEIIIIQKGNIDAPLPKLGKDGINIVQGFIYQLANSYSDANLIEQYYHFNNSKDDVNRYINPQSSIIECSWRNFYISNRNNITFKNADSDQLNIYQNYFAVFSAIYYYNMAVLWGDIPYITEYTFDLGINRTPVNEIFNNTEKELLQAINNLEEKRNESLNSNMNKFFFISKDVARIALANIYTYQGKYNEAEKLLKKVIDNAYYELDNSNYNNLETIKELYINRSSKEIIMAFYKEQYNNNTVNGEYNILPLIPVMTYTDVMLLYAECLYKNNKENEANSIMDKIIEIKNITVEGSNTLERIKYARLKLTLYCNTNFAFLKRNSFAKDIYNVEEYQLLLPIPINEIMINPNITQNPGY